MSYNLKCCSFYPNNFDASALTSGLYRVDIVVANAEPNLGSQIDKLFSWSGNNCLSSAVRNVLQHCNPQGSCVYSYFIRMNQ